MLKKFIKKTFNRFGYDIKKFDLEIKSFDEIYKNLIENFSSASPIIFDIGGHRGESIKRFRNLFPNSIIHCFEPDEENFKILKNNFTENRTYLNNFGIGNTNGKLKFYRNVKSDTSSFKKPNLNSVWVKRRSKQYKVEPEKFISKIYEVEVRKIDDYLKKNNIENIHLLKIDTQGYEIEVFEGAVDTLKDNKVDIIETELIVGNAYENYLSFSDIEKIIKPYNYRFYGINEKGNLYSNPYLQFDVMYVREDLIQ